MFLALKQRTLKQAYNSVHDGVASDSRDGRVRIRSLEKQRDRRDDVSS